MNPKRRKFTARVLEPHELHDVYGDRKTPIGETYSSSLPGATHYYLQRRDDVLHVSMTFFHDATINTLPAGYLNDEPSRFNKIEYDEFNNAIRQAIYMLDLTEFWKTNET